MSSKNSIRQRLLSKRSSLDESTVQNLSGFIQDAVIASAQFMNSRTIAIYTAIRNEVRTDRIADVSLLTGKRLYFPRWYPKHTAIRFFEVTNVNQLETTTWGTQEPPAISSKENTQFDFDLILVPGVAFDKNGHRLGYGYGGYDRVLAGISQRAWGLAYDLQVVDSIPVEPHDVPCAQIITEKRWIQHS